MGQSVEDIVFSRLGQADGGVLLRTFDRQGWTIVNKAELLALKRAAARLEKLEAKNSKGNGRGTKTGRMSVR